jgi:hypothetical protein
MRNRLTDTARKARARLFPATREETARYREARNTLARSGRAERAQGIRDETPRFHDLNRAVAQAERPLSPLQRDLHFHRALFEQDRERAADRRAARTGRGAR